MTWGQASQGSKVGSYIAFTFPAFSGVAQGSIILQTDTVFFLASLQGPGGAGRRPLVAVRVCAQGLVKTSRRR